jgi:hypothetical protein
MASSRMLEAFMRCSRIHNAASCHSVRIFVCVIASGMAEAEAAAAFHLVEDQR